MAASKRKTTAAIVAGVAAAALVLGGTFAWTSISQQARNETIVDINPGGRLHDDFNGVNKDIYVENFGNKDSGVPIFARIRLDEYMEIGPDAGKKKNDPDRKAEVLDNDDTDTNTPDINDVTTWQTYVPGADSFEHKKDLNETVYTEYWDWTLGRTDELPYYMPTFNKNKDSLKADINGTYEGLIPGDIVHYDDYTEYQAGDTTGGTEIYDKDSDTNEEDEAGEYDNGGITYSDATATDEADVYHKVIADTDADAHAAAQITYGSTVISMAEWLTYPEDDRIGPFWVYDEDGWAYWAQPIEPGTTTGLLLDGIHMTKTPDDNWYYGINAVGQFTTAADWELLYAPEDEGGAGADSMTDNGKILMHTITSEKSIHAILTIDDPTAAAGSETYTLSFLTTRSPFEPGTAYAIPASSGASTLAAGDSAVGDTIVAVYNDAVGKREYKYETIPWKDYRAKITTVNFDTKIEPRLTKYWFVSMSNLTTVNNLENLVTSSVENMTGMFQGCSSLTQLDISNWDVKNVKSINGLFYGCRSLSSIGDISNWETDNLTRTDHLFYGCAQLTTIGDLSNWKMGKVSNMGGMFRDCTNLSSIGNISGWNVSSADNMGKLFENCSTLNGIGDLKNWDVSNVKDMNDMFYGCSSLTSVGDLTNWKTGNVTNMSGMFRGCSVMTTVGDLSNWDVSQVTGMNAMFASCSNLTTIGELDQWKTGNLVTTAGMFYDCSNLSGVGDLSNWDVSKVTTMNSMFYNCKLLSSFGDLNNWQTGEVEDMTSMFQGCTTLTTLDLSQWDVSQVTTMTSMFRGCTNLSTLNLSSWKVGNVLQMNGLFYYCNNLTSVGDLSQWDVSNVTTMESMFNSCGQLSMVGDISGWNTVQVGKMNAMFNSCAGLTLDLRGWNVANVTDYANFNAGATNIQAPNFPS